MVAENCREQINKSETTFLLSAKYARQVAEVSMNLGVLFAFSIDIRSLRKQSLTQSSKNVASNPRGIPHAPFVDKVEDYVSSRAEVDGTMKSFQEMISCDESQSYGLYDPS